MSLVYEVNHASNIPQTAISGFAPRGLAWHWTAGAVGRDGALGTVRHFQNTRYTVNASYHVLFWHDHAGEVTGAMEIVPLTKASHSLNPSNAFVPKLNSARERERFVEVHRILARDSDPNADSVSLSFCGMPADLAVAARCPTFRADMKVLNGYVSQRVPTIIDRPHYGHGWIQPISRYETDAAGYTSTVPMPPDLLIAPILYAAEDDVYDWAANIKAITPERVTFREGTSYRVRPDLSPESKPKVYGVLTRTVIGTVQGFDFGAGPTWLVLISLSGAGLLVAHEQDVVRREPLGGGFTQKQLDDAARAAQLNGFAEGRDKAAAAGFGAAKAVQP